MVLFQLNRFLLVIYKRIIKILLIIENNYLNSFSEKINKKEKRHIDNLIAVNRIV